MKVSLGMDPVEAAQSLAAEDLRNEALRGSEAAAAASKIAVIPEVRAALVDFQRAFATRAGGAVLDGRDIGTVICPDAQVKIFVTASPEVRAARRHKELLERGEETALETVLADVIARDERDQSRSVAPLKPADDAVLLDTSNLSIEDAISAAISLVQSRRS